MKYGWLLALLLRLAGGSSDIDCCSERRDVCLSQLEKFCTGVILPQIRSLGDYVVSVSPRLSRSLRVQNIADLNCTLQHEYSRLGFKMPCSTPHAVWDDVGNFSDRTKEFLDVSWAFCRSAALATDVHDGKTRHTFCRRVGFVHIPKSVRFHISVNTPL